MKFTTSFRIYVLFLNSAQTSNGVLLNGYHDRDSLSTDISTKYGMLSDADRASWKAIEKGLALKKGINLAALNSGSDSPIDLKGLVDATISTSDSAKRSANELAKAAEEKIQIAERSSTKVGAEKLKAAEDLETVAMARRMEASNLQSSLQMADKALKTIAEEYQNQYQIVQTQQAKLESLGSDLKDAQSTKKRLSEAFYKATKQADADLKKAQSLMAEGKRTQFLRAQAAQLAEAARRSQKAAEEAANYAREVAKNMDEGPDASMISGGSGVKGSM